MLIKIPFWIVFSGPSILQYFKSQMDQQRSSNQEQSRSQHSNSSGIRPVPPTLLRIFADNHDKRSLCIFWSLFFFIIVLVSILSITLPEELLQKTNKVQLEGTQLQGCDNPNTFEMKKNGIENLICNPSSNTTVNQVKVGTVLRRLQKLNQFAIVFLNFYTQNKQAININETVEVELIDINEQKEGGLIHFYKEKSIKTNQTSLYLHSLQSIKIYGQDNETVIGYKYPIFVDRDLNLQTILLLITFKNPQKFENIDTNLITSHIVIVNPQFTKYTFAIRYVFFFLSLLFCIAYLFRYCKIPEKQRIIEQKIIAALSILIVMFNDPFYPITILIPNQVSSYFSVFFVVNFIILLLFLWIVFLDRIFYEDCQKQSQMINWKRYIYTFVTYLLTLILYVQYAIDTIEDLPIIPAQDLLAPQFIVLQVSVLIFVCLGFMYILVMYIRICMSVGDKLWRNQMFMFFSFFFLITTLILFIVNGFRIHTFHGNRILLLYTEMNMYTFYLQYMYSVTSDQYERIKRGHFSEKIDDDVKMMDQIRSVPESDRDFVELDFGNIYKNSLEKQKENFIEEEKKDNMDSFDLQ